ncbi:MAG: LD-carboxypeptidase [Rhodothermales bacterium]|nr:LD-carboxypeptidase [Rhodothermales bacterium]
MSTIAVVTPAGPPRSVVDLERGCALLSERGYHVVGPSRRLPFGYLAGTDEERVGELNDRLNDPSIDALFCARGGFGTLRILDRVDYEALRKRPRLLVGYSDITALQLAWYSQAGVPSISGPMVGVDWPALPPAYEQQFWSLACGVSPTLDPDGATLSPVRSGEVDGLLLGGNLSLIARLVGTPYLPSLAGAILFLEDVGESAYRIDGLLAQLRLAGWLDRLGGLVLGGFTGFPEPDTDAPLFDALVASYFDRAPYPVARGLRYGHFSDKIAVPIGIHARLTVSDTAARLSLLEGVVDVSDSAPV